MLLISSYNYFKDKNKIIGYYSTQNQTIRSESGKKFDDQNVREFSMYIDALIEISNRSNLENFLVEIPENQSSFWKYCKWVSDCRSQVSFLIPAITNMAAYNGYNDKTMRNKKVFGHNKIGTYGYNSYYHQADLSACQYNNIQGLITVELNDKIIQINIEKC